jgi:hypothetical protein
LRHDRRVVKHIPWTAFKLREKDWEHVIDVRDILQVGLIALQKLAYSYKQDSNNIQQHFSAEKQPTLWRMLPALEALQSAWEAKRDKCQYLLYRDALNAGLLKLKKYYS